MTTGVIVDARENLLDREIELVRRIMMEVSQKKPATVKQRRSSKRKTTEDYESIASGTMQHKVWRLGEEQQTKAATNGKLQHKIWDPGRQRAEEHDQVIMIIFNIGSLMQEHQAQFLLFICVK